MFYDKLVAPPRPGSLQEALCILVQRYRQEQRFYLALAGLHQGAKEKQETFDAYKRAMYPYIEASGKRSRDRTKELLDEAFKQGPILIRTLSGKEKYEVKDD